MRPYGIIYCITNIINGKKYIGLTTFSLEKRWIKHINNIKHVKNSILYNAFRKYGIENFIIEQIDIAKEKFELDKKEQYWIFELGAHISNWGYNMTWGGNDPGRPNIESREKNRKSQKGKKREPFSDEWKQHIREARAKQIMKPMTNEQKMKISIANKGENNGMYGKCGDKHPNYGKKVSEETRRKLSESHKGQVPWNKGKKIKRENI